VPRVCGSINRNFTKRDTVSRHLTNIRFPMEEKEIINRIKKVKSFAGMTVNEMLYVSELSNEFYDSMDSDKIIAEKILQHLNLNKNNIEQILKKSK